MSTIELKVPDIGGYNNVDVIDVLIAEGDEISVEQALITLETDKATMDVPAEQAGIVKKLQVRVGDKVSEGTVILQLETIATQVPDTAPITETAAPVAPSASLVPATKNQSVEITEKQPEKATQLTGIVDEAGFAKAHAGPSARKFARELGVDLSLVAGSGHKGRITTDDIKLFVKNVMANGTHTASANGSMTGLDLLPWPKIDFSQFGPVETVPLSRIKKISGANLARNWIMIPHVTMHEEADMTELEAFRKQLNKEWEKASIKLSPLAFIIKAVTAALQVFPDFNASLDGDNLVVKQYYHIGFAADTPNGLVVPVIRDSDKKGLKDLSESLTALSSLAREGKLKPADMQGGTFTISSLGGIGGTGFNPIINAPEVAILGVCKNQMKPRWNGSTFEPRLMCPLSLSFDHRVIDGASGMRFLVYLAQLLGDFRRISL